MVPEMPNDFCLGGWNDDEWNGVMGEESNGIVKAYLRRRTEGKSLEISLGFDSSGLSSEAIKARKIVLRQAMWMALNGET